MNYENYENKLKYPAEKHYGKYEIITANQVYSNLNYNEYQKLTKELQQNNILNLRVLRSIDKDSYNIAQEKYDKEERRINNLFEQDLKDYYGDFSDYENGEELFSAVNYRAYKAVNGAGRQSVAEAYGELYDFVREILKLTEKND